MAASLTRGWGLPFSSIWSSAHGWVRGRLGPTEGSGGDGNTTAPSPAPSTACSYMPHTAWVAQAAIQRREGEERTAPAATAKSAESSRLVHLGPFHVTVRQCFLEESVDYRFPVMCHRYRHSEDGSLLTIMSEELSALAAPLSVDAYTEQSIERMRQAAAAVNAYFKVTLSTTANKVVTSIMSNYVNINIGPGPIVIASFITVSHKMAFTIQLQAHAEFYHQRLADVLTTVQQAALDPLEARTHQGHCICLVPNGAEPTTVAHAVRVPSCISVRECPGGGGLRVAHRQEPQWEAEVITTTAATYSPFSAAEAPTWSIGERAYLVVVRADSDDDSPSPSALADIEHLVSSHAIVASIMGAQQCSSEGLSNVYVSPHWVLPLPSVRAASTTVCEHLGDAFFTLFMRIGDDGDLYEVEVGVVQADSAESLLAHLKPLFRSPTSSKQSVNQQGCPYVSAEGLSSTLGEDTSIRVDSVCIAPGRWLTFQWLFSAKSSVFPVFEEVLNLWINISCTHMPPEALSNSI